MTYMAMLEKICEDENIRLVGTNDDIISASGGGAIFKQNDIKGIVYDKTLTKWPYLTTISHELAHHILGHLDSNLPVENVEMEARIFSAVFTAIALFTEYFKESK